jgi:type I restriction enzyme S subunit
MAVWATVPCSRTRTAARIDAEFYQPHLLGYENAIANCGYPIRALGQLIEDGYRVVYENTEIHEGPCDPRFYVRFLQATDISETMPAIAVDRIGWVHRSDWLRYPKGRAKPRELLVEVKGKAEKVAIIPDDFPPETLITGSVYKFTTKESQIRPLVLLCYLLSKYGKALRLRSLANTLIGFVSKRDLHRIPVPILPAHEQDMIERSCRDSLTLARDSENLYAEGLRTLESCFGLGSLDLSRSIGYQAKLSETAMARRWDSEFYKPKYRRVISAVLAARNVKVERFTTVGRVVQFMTNGHTPLRHDLSIGEVPFLTAEHVSDYRTDFNTDKRILLQHHRGELARTALHDGDVLVTIKGKVGNCAIVTDCPPRANINQDVALLRLHNGIDPYFFAAWFNSLMGKQLIEQRSTGGINPFVGLGNLRGMPFPVLPKPDERRIGERVRETVEAAHAALKRSKSLLEQAKRRVEELIEKESAR